MNNLKDLDIDSIVAAVIANDSDAAQIASSLKKSLQQAQAGEYSTAYAPSPIVQTWHTNSITDL